jgi:tetratricopeptide (TPR) repeat protein
VISNRILFEETVPTVPHFIGRAAELTAYHAQLQRDRFLIITGLAGMGKTTLGAKLAREMAATPDQIFWFTFDSIEKSTTDALYWALATFLDNRGEPSLAKYLRGEIGAQKPLERMAKLNLLLAALSTGHYILCFDDVQIAQDVPDIAYFFKLIRQRFVELKQPLPATFILMGRSVPPDMEHLVAQSLRGLTADEMIPFLVDRNVVLPRELVQQLWQHTEGNPKLLELSASNLAGLSAEAAATFIATLVRRGDIRDYLMRNIYATLTPDEQTVMGALAVFPGPIARDGVEELLAEEQTSRVAQHLDALVNKHVLTLDENDQIDCHDLVREYCYHILTRRDRDRFHQGAAQYFEQEQNWLAAGVHHFERRDYNTALSLLTEHAEAIINGGQLRALSDQLARFNSVTLTPEQRVKLYQMQGNCLRIRGEYQQAVAALEAALEEAITDQERANTLQQLGLVSINAGDYPRAAEYLQHSLLIYETTGDNTGLGRVHQYLGSNNIRQGQIERAGHHYRISIGIATQLGDRQMLANANVGLGLVLWKQGQLLEAQTRLEDSRRIYRELHDRFGEANALDSLALVYGDLGDLPRRILHHQQALHIDDETGNLYGWSLTLNNLAHAYQLSENYTAALSCYERLAQKSRAAEHTPMLSIAQAGLADAYLGLQQPSAALQQAELSWQVARQIGAPFNLGVSSRVLGDVWLALSEPQRAVEYYEQSIPWLTTAAEPDEVRRAQAGRERALTLLSN